MKWVCEQRGCGEFAVDYFDADDDEHLCPVCQNPLVEHDGEICQGDAGDVEIPWTDYSVNELREYVVSWELTDWTFKTNKDGLIALLEAAEAE